MKRLVPVSALLLCAACAALLPTPGEPVRPGLELFVANPPEVVRGKRVGLITNQTGADRQGRSAIDLLDRSDAFDLVALYSPEHGIRGASAPGEHVASGADERTGLPVHSLYGETRKPTPEMLEGVEALVFDLQDVGARQYTYVSTLALAMQAAAGKRIPAVVLDRPNPIGGRAVEGNVLDPRFSTFVGMYPVPVRHGMTVGELARMLNREFGIGAELMVVPVDGWEREEWFDETGLPWIDPSPNLRSLEAVTLRVDSGAAKYPGRTLPGVRLHLVDRESYRPVETSLRMIDLIRRLHPDDFAWSSTLDRVAGTDRLRHAIEGGTLPALLAEWAEDAERFRFLREPYLLYR